MNYGGIFVVLRLLFAAAVMVECIFTPLYLKALWPQKCFKSLCLKMVCSAMFFSVGILSLFIAENNTEYAYTVIAALALGWVGDYFLHAKGTQTYFIIGFISFLLGHVVYITAFLRRLALEFPEAGLVNVPGAVAFAVIAVTSVIIACALKMKFSPHALKYACAFYAVILITMFIKASELGIRFYMTGSSGGLAAAVIIISGSFLFLLSDASLAVILFGGKKGSYPLKIFNIATYFPAQVLLAATILFFK